MKNSRSIHIISILLIICSLVTTAMGLFFKTPGTPYEVVNQYGDVVRIYGSGLYKNDSYFMAPIAKGTDFAFLFIGVPLLIISLILDVKKESYRSRLRLLSAISIFAYYATSICFGITYNILHLLYIAIFSLSIFGLIVCFRSLDEDILIEKIDGSFVTKGLYIFLFVSGISIFVAWLPDIATSLLHRQSLQLIEVYTTQITYVLDMGLISPAIFICIYSLFNKKGIGLSLLGIILMTCSIVGASVSAGTLFQYMEGIVLPIPVLVTKVSIFIVLALISLMFTIRLYKNIRG